MSLPFEPRASKLMVGLEIHQQLGTATKLFCSCPIIKSEVLPFSFRRRLRPTQSELGQIDPAAVFEFNKGKVNLYEWSPDSSCMVDADDEPPHEVSPDALETTMLIAEMLGSTQVDEVHVMRKIVIDGSNTTGFQRTAVVALGGAIATEGGEVAVQTITFEEDSSRVLGEDESSRKFALDRLGVPLVEIALAPITGGPDEAEALAFSLGRALRSTGRVARGLGTIRQDLNISVMGGEVVEVKGVQKLNLIAKVVRYEAVRQMGLIKISEELKKRGISKVSATTVDATPVFGATKSAILKRTLKNGGVVHCVAVAGMAGLLGAEPFAGIRLGKELAEVARTNGLGGVIHSDEFAKNDITSQEASALLALSRSDAKAGLVLVAGDRLRVETVAKLVSARLSRATNGVPGETRAATEDGETRYLRPRPGAARMYPETDIPPIVVTEEQRRAVKKMLPVPWREKVRSYSERYSLSGELALQLYDSDNSRLFEELAPETKLEPSLVASILIELPTRLSREGIDESRMGDDVLRSVVRALGEGKFAKEATIEVMRTIGKGDAKSVDEAIDKLGITGLSEAELRKIVAEVIKKNKPLIAEKGERSFSVLMGEVMRVARGRVDGQRVSAVLKEAMKAR